jgi:hypothetical protein
MMQLVAMPNPAAKIIAATKHWLETAVIGLDLCPFARAVHALDLIRYAVSEAETPEGLLKDLVRELHSLEASDPAEIETTLLIHPRVLGDFLDYNEFLSLAEAAVAELGLTGVLQIASFHPRYQFDGTGPDDVENCTNRSPYPILHLLREASVERAVAAFPDASRIYEKNIATLRLLGHEGWTRLGVGPEAARGDSPAAQRSTTAKGT